MGVHHNSSDVVIIGGGVIGLSLAYHLAREGATVAVLERGQIGQEASTAGAGILAPQAEMEEMDPLTELCLASKALYRDFVEELVAKCGIDIEFSQTGLLYVAFSRTEEEELEKRYRWQRQRGLLVEELSPTEALQLEKNLSPSVSSAIFFPEEAHVDNVKLMEALRIACLQLQVRLVTGCQGMAVRSDGSRVTVVESNLGSWSTQNTVIAAGSWSGLITTPLSYQVQVNPARGQMVAVKSPAPFLKRPVYSHRGYLVPRRDGRIFLGTTVESAGYDKSVTVEGLHQIIATALEVFPGIKTFPISGYWAGFRPRVDDGNPVLGATEVQGLFFATGHFRNGLLLAPITAKLLADLILNRNSSPLLEAFTPLRFKKGGVHGRP
jgi:glycine oxidase